MFSRSASQRAASLEAPWTDSTYTEAPVMLRSAIESACTEMNMSACAARARAIRSRSTRNSSRSRVRTARIPDSALMRPASARAMASVTSFSRVPPCPMAPGSTPPCPASTAMMTSRSPSPGACAARTVFGGAAASSCAGSPRLSTSCPPSSPGAHTLCAASADRSCTTTRSVPSGWLPTRTSVTTPEAAGTRTSLARRVCGRSMTTRSGCSRVKSLCVAPSLISSVTCAEEALVDR